MAFPNILILEPDIAFAQKLQKKLRELDYLAILKTAIQDPEELLKLSAPIHTVVLNVELQELEGFTVYSFLKEKKEFKESTFVFLADNHNIYILLREMPLERAIVLEKSLPFEQLMQKIINFIPIPTNYHSEHNYFREVMGELAELSLNELLDYCRLTLFTGYLTLSNLSQSAKIILERGEIQEVQFQHLPQFEALDILKSWKTGHFVLERKQMSVAEIKEVLSEKFSGSRYHIELSDLFTDVFHFLYQYLSLQLTVFELNSILEKHIRVFNENSSLKIFFDPLTEDVFSIEGVVLLKNVPELVELLSDIFQEARKISSEIDLQDYFDYLQEIKPYLDEINFFDLLREFSTNVHPAKTPSSGETVFSSHIEKVA